MSMTRVPVLIAGGGTVGLSAALFLAHHGVATLLVERQAAPSPHPRGRPGSARARWSSCDR
jgi:putative polyketide hydroxylase